MKYKRHIQELKDSLISDEIAKKAKLKSFTKEEAEKILGYGVSGLGFPYLNLKGEYIGTRLRKDTYSVGAAKYLQTQGSSLGAYFLEETINQILDHEIPLIIVEGEKKLCSFYSNITVDDLNSSFAVVAIPGCWNHSYKDTNNESQLHDVWFQIPMKGRFVKVIPDTDYFFNENVKNAYNLLAQKLCALGACVSIHDIRVDSDTRLGLDDFIILKGKDEFKYRVLQKEVMVLGGNHEK